jgi:hypothetical protein
MQLADLDEAGDFVFTFAVVHELPSAASYFSEATRTMKHGADLLLAEPAGHAHQTGVDGSELARTFCDVAALVGAAMCSACLRGSRDRWP